MPDASPLKWHLAHTTWFFETFLLAPNHPGYRTFNPNYGFLFNFYHNAVGDRHPHPGRGMLSRPQLDEILAYQERWPLTAVRAQDCEWPGFDAALHEIGHAGPVFLFRQRNASSPGLA